MNRTTDTAALAGRVLLAALFLWGGYGKLMSAAATTGYFAKIGLPLPQAAVGLAILVELVGGLLFLVGFMTRPVALALAAWSIATALVAHTDFADRNMLIHFLKNVGLAGGFLYVAAFGAGAFSLDAMRTRRTGQTLSYGANI